MKFRTETYVGYSIRAYAYQSVEGYLPQAIVALAADQDQELVINPPAQLFTEANSAIETAMYWARDRVDELVMNGSRGRVSSSEAERKNI